LENYEKLSRIGMGNSQVHEVRSAKDNKQYALKEIIINSEGELTKVHQEIKIHRFVTEQQVPNIV